MVASVMVLQALEGLSDRDAARALRDQISSKVACGLAASASNMPQPETVAAFPFRPANSDSELADNS
jgi:hypothetical protein